MDSVSIVLGEVNELGDWTKNGTSKRNSFLNQELKSPDISILEIVLELMSGSQLIIQKAISP